MKNLLLSCVSFALLFTLSACSDDEAPQPVFPTPANATVNMAARTGGSEFTGIEVIAPYKWQLVKTGVIKNGQSLILHSPFQIGDLEERHLLFSSQKDGIASLEPINTSCLNLGAGTIKDVTLEYLKNYPYKTDKIFTSPYPDAFWPVHLYKNSIIACKNETGDNFLLQVKNIRMNTSIEVDLYQAVKLTFSN